MKSPVYLLLFLLALSPVIVYAESQTISVETDSSSYEKGSSIAISGLITNYDASDPNEVFQITLRVIAPNNNIVTVDQIVPNSGGTYSTSVNTEGANWKLGGDYTVMVNYADQSASTTFTLIIPEIEAAEAEAVEAEAAEAETVEAEAAEAEAAEKCGEGTHLEDGVCVLDETVSAESTPASSTSSAETVSSWIHSITFSILIAFVIAILLFLISRASRRKTT
uniref:Macroglobulin domain-containing protein n=2 Tax=environmental samples TaxID=651140 RepID=A0A075HRX0_9ARCH|nr:hypothetical protein [uncultured marine thaumarchaeote KM3_15_C08]AIF17142.1 hypothetical protein [uncultured marine thaumarchaeote KM3_76_B07]